MHRLLLATTAVLALSACAPPSVPVAAAGPLASPSERVERVIDGDTFVVASGEKVRVLGIDSCERGTAGGAAATAEAHRLLDGHPVVLTAEPGHDRDRYDRELRYVRLEDGRDYGLVMVAETHTAVYGKRNDASARYVAKLRAADGNGRVC